MDAFPLVFFQGKSEAVCVPLRDASIHTASLSVVP